MSLSATSANLPPVSLCLLPASLCLCSASLPRCRFATLSQPVSVRPRSHSCSHTVPRSRYTGQGGTSFTSVPLQLRQSTDNYHFRCHEPLPDQSQILRSADPDTSSDGFRLYLGPASAPPTMFPRHNGARGFSQGEPDMVETRYDSLRPLGAMTDVSPVFRHNELLHTPMGARAHVRAKADWRPSIGEDPRLYQVARGAEDAMVFPLGPVDSPYFKPLSRQEKEYTLTHTTNGERRRFRRGQPEPPLKKINICSELCHR